MKLSRLPPLPLFLQRRHADEFAPPPYSPRDKRVIERVVEKGPRSAGRLGAALGDYWSSRTGTAAGLLELNRAAHCDFYRVPPEAELDREAALEAFRGDEVVVDVQTHFVSDRPEAAGSWNRAIRAMYQALKPGWWKGIDPITAYDMAEYLRCVFLESETAVAVLTSGPGLGPDRMLFNREMAATRELLDGFGASGRLLNHCVVHANVPAEIEGMERERDARRPVGWKVYTMGAASAEGVEGAAGWYLDDERTGVPFLERALELEVPLVCAHKGISQMVPTGSPRDVGPAARGFPAINFVIYHSGYEFPTGDAAEEGPFCEETADIGVNRLVKSLRDARVPAGSNVYAELGTTWFCLLRPGRGRKPCFGDLSVAFLRIRPSRQTSTGSGRTSAPRYRVPYGPRECPRSLLRPSRPQ